MHSLFYQYFSVVSCQGEYSSNYDEKQTPMSTSEDVKPSYLVGYGSVSSSSQAEQGSKSDYDPYYNKLQSMKPEEMKIPKTEITTTSSCSISGRSDLLVPKTEANPNACRSPPTGIRPAYDPYLNQDSNSSSMSSVENINARPHHQMHHSVMAQHLNPQQSSYAMEDTRQHQMAHRSPYHQSPMPDDIYHRSEHSMRSYTDMSDSMVGQIARPVVTYPNDITGRTYDTSMVNSSSHRPYDPGTNTAFERYDSSNQCGTLQQPLMPPRVPPQGMYGYVTLEEQQEQRYQQEAVQQHQMALANATAASMMKTEGDQESTGPLYPR